MKIYTRYSLPVLLLLFCIIGPVSITSAADHPTLKKITFHKVNQNHDEIVFVLNGTYIPKTFAIKGKKPRVVFDFHGVAMALTLPNSIEADGNFVQRIRLGRHFGESPKTRVVFDLVPGKKIRFSQNFDRENNRLTIVVLSDEDQSPPTRTASPGDQAKKEYKRKPSSQVNTGQPEKKNIPDNRVAATKASPSSRTDSVKPATAPRHQPSATGQVVSGSGEDTSQRQTDQASPTDAPSTKSATSTKVSPVSETIQTAVLDSVVFDNSSTRGEMVQFSLTDFHPPKVFGIEEGIPRVVCDFSTTRAGKKLPQSIETNGRWVKAIRIGRYSNPDRVRVVIDLAPNNNYDLQQVFFKEENLFVIIVNTAPSLPSPNQAQKEGTTLKSK